MYLNPKKDEVESKEGKIFKRHLKVNSVTHPVLKEDDWSRKSHSSPIKGYRRFSGEETNNIEVKSPRISCIFQNKDIDFFMLVTLCSKNCNFESMGK